MEAKHTPGPWNVAFGEDGLVIDAPESGICTVDSPLSERAANAKLIAAAPDLLEALNTLLYVDPVNHYGLMEAESKAIAAIKKATE